MMPPVQRTIVPPAGGWRERTYYSVRISFRPSNPVHPAIFYSGFLLLEDGGPGGYNVALSPMFDNRPRIEELHYLQVVAELNHSDER